MKHIHTSAEAKKVEIDNVNLVVTFTVQQRDQIEKKGTALIKKKASPATRNKSSNATNNENA